MAMADELNLDPNMLLTKEYEDHDILNEFLDQRVFDSLNANTPTNSHQLQMDDMSLFHNDVTNRLEENMDRDIDAEIHSAFSLTDLPVIKDEPDYSFHSPRGHGSLSHNLSPRQSLVDLDYNHGSPLEDYDNVRKLFSKVKFGNHFMNPCPPSIDVSEAAVLDFSPETMANLPYELDVLNTPSSSRVETQIKLRFQLSPPPPETFLHIPQDLISKSKLCLQDPVDSLPEIVRSNMLYLETYVMTSDMKKSCSICPRCIKREQKRASRSKPGPNDGSSDSPTACGSLSARVNSSCWDEAMIKKAIFFNCKEIMCFPAPTGLSTEHSKALDISARIICYCRHHKELTGFKLLFVVRDFEQKIVAKHMSAPIMIMDRKKNLASQLKGSASQAGSSTQLSRMAEVSDDLHDPDSNIHPLSPNSIDDSNSEALANTDTNTEQGVSRGYKRKKLSIDDSYNSSTNPMFNGSGFSPVSNSDTNASVHNLSGKGLLSNTSFKGHTQPLSIPRQRLLQQLQLVAQTEQQPAIQKIIPSQGPIRGGIEVTLLGFNFRPGLTVKFGAKTALASHCWSESTIVTYLPPAAQPGQVLVSFEDHEHLMGGQQLIFTYTDDTDRQLIELALQIVGLKMNGKLEDAKNIAKRIVGSDTADKANSNVSSPGSTSQVKQESMEWYDNAHKAVEKLTRSDMSTEDILINFLSLVDLPNCPIIIPNWQLCNSQGQALIHLATLRNYKRLVGFLITHGCKVEIKDNQGLTPLFFATMCGFRELINVFVECKSNLNLKFSNEKTMRDYCDLNVLDVFTEHEADQEASQEDDGLSQALTSDSGEENVIRSCSIDSLNSLYMMNYGKHISRLAIESSDPGSASTASPRNKVSSKAQYRKLRQLDQYGTDSTDFADSEQESEDESSVHLEIKEGWKKKIREEDYLDEVYDEYSSSDGEVRPSSSRAPEVRKAPGIWQKMKTAVFSNDSDTPLPTYDDLFPFGNGFMRPKTALEQHLNTPPGQILEVDPASGPSLTKSHLNEDVQSDSSEDMAYTYMNNSRKAIRNDKMLLFFWLPVLIMILAMFIYLSVTGYQLALVERLKETGRNAIGNIILGNERISHAFTKKPLAVMNS